MKPEQLKKLIKKREKEGVICIPTNAGYMFYFPNGIIRDICVKD